MRWSGVSDFMDWRFEAAQHAAEREAARVHREMARGLGGLATVAATAPWLGMVWTVGCFFGYCFPAVGAEKSIVLAIETDRISQAIVPTALGLGVAIVSTWGLRCFRTQLGEFDLEMRVAAEELPGLIAAGLRAGS